MLALCQHNGAAYYAQNYAGIIGASLLHSHVTNHDTKKSLFIKNFLRFHCLGMYYNAYVCLLFTACLGVTGSKS